MRVVWCATGFIVRRMKTVLDKSKAPTAHQHFLEWLKVRVEYRTVQCIAV